MQSLTEYMKKELIFYIKQEYDKGVPLQAIKNALLEGGHHSNLVNDALRSLQKNKFNVVKALNEPVKSNLDKDLYFNIMNSLVKYIEYQLAAGKNITEVKKILSEYGHSEKMISQAIKKVNKSEPRPQNTFRIFDIAFIIVFLLGIMIITGISGEPIEYVLFGFSATILTVAALNFIPLNKTAKKTIWIYPFAFPSIFFAVSYFQLLPFSADTYRLFILNVILSVLYAFIKSMGQKDVDHSIAEISEEVMVDSDEEADKAEKKEDKKDEKKEDKEKK